MGRHLAGEFTTKDVEATLATMVDDASVDHVPVHTGGRGKDALRVFYRDFSSPRGPTTWSRPRSIASSATARSSTRSAPGSPTTGRWSGSSPACRPRIRRSTSTSSSSCSSATVRSPASGSTGTRRPCCARWVARPLTEIFVRPSYFPGSAKRDDGRNGCNGSASTRPGVSGRPSDDRLSGLIGEAKCQNAARRASASARSSMPGSAGMAWAA